MPLCCAGGPDFLPRDKVLCGVGCRVHGTRRKDALADADGLLWHRSDARHGSGAQIAREQRTARCDYGRWTVGVRVLSLRVWSCRVASRSVARASTCVLSVRLGGSSVQSTRLVHSHSTYLVVSTYDSVCSLLQLLETAPNADNGVVWPVRRWDRRHHPARVQAVTPARN